MLSSLQVALRWPSKVPLIANTRTDRPSDSLLDRRVPAILFSWPLVLLAGKVGGKSSRSQSSQARLLVSTLCKAIDLVACPAGSASMCVRFRLQTAQPPTWRIGLSHIFLSPFASTSETFRFHLFFSLSLRFQAPSPLTRILRLDFCATSTVCLPLPPHALC